MHVAPVRPLAALVLAVSFSAVGAQTLSGTAAQKSPQADTLLAYEEAMMKGGIPAAAAHMTPAKREELEGMAKMFGEAGFKEFVDRMRAGAQGEARRAQVQKVEVKGSRAFLEARDSPNALTQLYFAKTAQGWKVDVRPK